MTTNNTHYDVLVIGSGQGGNPFAEAAAAKGRRTAMIERGAVGGTCINYGCTPTKTMVASAEVAALARRGPEFGVSTGPISVDMPKVRERKRAMVQSWREGSEKRLSKDGVELIRGEGSFLATKGAHEASGPKRILVRLNDGGELQLTADLVVIDTGLSAGVPPLPGLDRTPFLDNVSIMELNQVPSHLLVLGGGYVGLEFGQMFRRFGSRVTIVQNAAQVLTQEDPDVAEEIVKILREDGIEVLLGTHAESAAHDSGTVRLRVTHEGTSRVLEGSHLLVATGRRPNTKHLNLDGIGVKTNEHGFITVDDRLQTTVPGIYALGDVNGGPAFTHISYDDYRILKANLLEPELGTENGIRTTKDRPLPYCMFIDPQLARVGLSERQAAAQGVAVKVARLPMSSVARAIETNQTHGFMKALVCPETERIVGAAVLGQDGGEIMAMLEIAMMGGLKYTTLRDAVLAHPTLAESLNKLFSTFGND